MTQAAPSTDQRQTAARFFGMAMVLLGIAGWWYNWHLATGQGKFSIKLCVFVPLALSGGLLMALRPEWAGPWRPDSTRGHKLSLIALLVFTAIGSGVEFYRLHQEVDRRAPQRKVIAWSPEMGRPTVPVSLASRAPRATATPGIPFLGRPYHLGSFNKKHNAMWEFVTGNETVENWTTMLTLIDRPDARTRENLDRLAEGILSTYRSRGARILLAKTMGANPESVFNYTVAAFHEPKEHRYELNFVKMQLHSGRAAVAVYGVRISDDQDNGAKVRQFLDANSNEIGRALENLEVPDFNALPRREF